MKRALILIFVLFGIFWTYQLTVPNPPYPEQTSFNTVYPSITPHSPLSADKLFTLVNSWRVSQKLPEFTKDNNLCEFAKERMKEIKSDWSHAGFLLNAKKTPYVVLGENLARDYNNENDTLNSWLNSASHEANLRDSYQLTCIATEDNYVIQLFANY